MLNWYLENGKESDVVLSSRVRLARNLRQIPFIGKANKKDKEEVLKIMEGIVSNIGYGLKIFKLKDMDDITKMELVEKNLISPEFALNNTENGAILINEEENTCIMLNEEDHLRIQVFGSGLEIENIMNLAIEIDEKIGKLIDYAYHDKYGFLTSCPTNVGTGARASIMVHLPALTKTGNINKILEVVNNFGMNIRGIYGENSKTQGNIYQISTKQSLGISEKEIMKNIKLITEKIIEQERLARKYLGKNKLELEDKVCRSYGILSSCKKISSNECNNLLSDIKLGTDLGMIEELTDLKVSKLRLYTKPANLQKYYGKKLDAYERDIKRAELIKQIIKE